MKKILSKEDLINFLEISTYDEEIFKYANKIRKENVGDGIYLRGLIEFSNICKCSCKYCGLRFSNNEIERYRFSKDEILFYAKNAVQLGYKTLVLQSGEDAFFSVDRICEIVREIKKLGVALTLSIGERSYDELKAIKREGADRYLLRIETTDESLYKKMHPNMDYKNRINCLYNLKKLGYETGTGCLVGLPEQTIESLANDILFFKELDADMVGIGPFIPCNNTPLENEKEGSFVLALKVMALTRIFLPNINIPATTAMETINPEGRIIALQSGANVIMPNVIDKKYSEKYVIYPNKDRICDNVSESRSFIEDKIKLIGRYISDDFGFRKS